MISLKSPPPPPPPPYLHEIPPKKYVYRLVFPPHFLFVFLGVNGGMFVV